MSKKLISFDFDGTLIMTPLEEEGKKTWSHVTGQKYPHKGWWSHPESLDTNIFKPEHNPWVIDEFRKSTSEDNYVFIATGRIKKLENEVKKVLELNNIFKREKPKTFGYDDLFTNTGGETFYFKTKLFEKIISENSDADEFIMYDDREEHLEKFCLWAEKQTFKIKIYNVNLQKKIF
jgi:hypothetical protein